LLFLKGVFFYRNRDKLEQPGKKATKVVPHAQGADEDDEDEDDDDRSLALAD
jgi:hypothetical protein